MKSTLIFFFVAKYYHVYKEYIQTAIKPFQKNPGIHPETKRQKIKKNLQNLIRTFYFHFQSQNGQIAKKINAKNFPMEKSLNRIFHVFRDSLKVHILISLEYHHRHHCRQFDLGSHVFGNDELACSSPRNSK